MTKEIHIVIIGAMGVGKTTVGRLLASELGVPFLDSDEQLRSRLGESGAEIASRDGVARLHEIELEVFLNMCSQNSSSVIAPAASVVDYQRGREAMREHLTIRLTAPEHILAVRRRRGAHRREVEPLERELLRNRRAGWLESVSRFSIDTGDLTVREVVDELVRRLDRTVL